VTTVGLIVPLLLSFVSGYLFTPLVRGMAVRWKLTEKPNGRGSRDIAHIGGIAIIGAVLFALIPVFLFHLPYDPLHRAFLPILITSGFFTFLLGIIDDLRSLHYMYKLFFQIAVSIFISAGGIVLLAHFSIVHLSLPVALLVFGAATVWMLAITTSFNLIDGIDGLASGLALIASVAFAAGGFLCDQPLVLALSIVIFGAVLAFLRYNFPPAKIFMGDSGSLFLGLIFGLITLLLLVPGTAVLYRAAGGVFILTIPLIDTVLAFLRRLFTKRPVFEADLKHLHHILLCRCESVRTVDILLWSVSAIFGLLGVLTMLGSVRALVLAVALQLAVFALALREMVHLALPREKVEGIMGRSGIATSRFFPRED
jgi:UDP-GlcNAc:undecaprenyl-phosphate GlcNAc-1-phosphate transferase